MSNLFAIATVILLPPDVRERAVRLSAALLPDMPAAPPAEPAAAPPAEQAAAPSAEQAAGTPPDQPAPPPDQAPTPPSDQATLPLSELAGAPSPDAAALPPPDTAVAPPPDPPTEPEIDREHWLKLDDDHLPHATLTQHFVRADDLEAAFERIEAVLRKQRPMTLRVSGGARSGSSVWMAIEKSRGIADLHARLMEALRSFERTAGGASAFVDGDARGSDVNWVNGYRFKSSFGSFVPHITLGHADRSPQVDSFEFTATTVAVCRLGRFCSCRRVLRSWELTA